MNSPAFGWALALIALIVGWANYGVQGLVLAITVIAFWLLLQFSRALRALREASGRPVGSIGNAVMLHSKIHAGMRLVEILKLTKSLGSKLADDPETFAWADAGGDRVVIELRGGKTSAVRLERAAPGESEPGTPVLPT